MKGAAADRDQGADLPGDDGADGRARSNRPVHHEQSAQVASTALGDGATTQRQREDGSEGSTTGRPQKTVCTCTMAAASSAVGSVGSGRCVVAA